MITSEMVEDLLKYGERINFECKKAEGGLPNSVWESYSSFANTKGGVILLGVEENLRETDIEKRFALHNLTNPEKMRKEFWDTINSKKVNVNILLDDNVGICKVRGCNILWIEVPQADYKHRPVYLNDNLLKGSYKRNHEGDYHCSEEEVKSMLRDASEFGMDGTLLDGFTMEENGFFFSNPGNLKLPVQVIYEGGHSVARNPKIQNMFRMIGLGDNIGSGFPAILQAWGEEKWRQPDLYDDQELYQVELRLWTVSLMPQECTEHLMGLFGVKYKHLNSHEQIILATAYLEGVVSNSRLQTVLGLHSVDVGKCLYHLVEEKMLLAEKKRRWTTYQINENYERQPEQVEIGDVDVQFVKLNKTDQEIYDFVKVNGFITPRQVMDITKLSTLQGASAALKRMADRGMLEKQKQGKRIFYKEK